MPLTILPYLKIGKALIETGKTLKDFISWGSVQLESVSIDTINSRWRTYDIAQNAFIDNSGNQSPFPILNFSFINNKRHTISLTAIDLKAKHLPSGISGIPRSFVLEPSIRYKIPIPQTNKSQHTPVKEMTIMSGHALKFQVELFSPGMKNEIHAVHGRIMLRFKFKFGSSASIKSPKIFLNCKSENEKIKLVYKS